MPLIRKYDHLFFDLDNTLWDFDVNARLALEQAVTTLHVKDQVEDVDSFYAFYEQTNSNLWEAYRKGEIRQSELVRKRFGITIDHFGISGVNPEVFNDRYLQLMPAYTRLVDGALETLSYLQSEGYPLHIITNGIREVQQYKVKNSGLAPYIEKIFASEDINAPKPDSRIFRHALMNCHAKKSRSMMIGDTWETDILGAIRMGIDYIFFCKNGKIPPHPQKNEIKQPENINVLSIPPANNTRVIKEITDLRHIL
jgi:putative hydrolase of the HAD superfamily